MPHTILTYGTLRPFTNTDVVKVPGKLYDLGWYPGIVLGNHENPDEGDSFVTCERITVGDQRLIELDRYEGYDPQFPESSLYLRKKIGEDFIYVYNLSAEGHDLIESGDWQQHTLERA